MRGRRKEESKPGGGFGRAGTEAGGRGEREKREEGKRGLTLLRVDIWLLRLLSQLLQGGLELGIRGQVGGEELAAEGREAEGTSSVGLGLAAALVGGIEELEGRLVASLSDAAEDLDVFHSCV